MWDWQVGECRPIPRAAVQHTVSSRPSEHLRAEAGIQPAGDIDRGAVADAFGNNYRRGAWVPAFAGTTRGGRSQRSGGPELGAGALQTLRHADQQRLAVGDRVVELF